MTVAIVGRPNVGKSTLFNRLAGKRLAIVHDTPGVTRDRQETLAQFGPLPLCLIDTAGFDDAPPGTLPARMLEQTRDAIAGADVCLFLIDGRAGLTTDDEAIADMLRRSGKPVILVANKCEAQRSTDVSESFRLGFGEPVTISAGHGLGLGELFDALAPFAEEEGAQAEDGAQDERELKLAIVGRPNVGKSSLFNRLIGEERALTGPEPGITRDAIAARWNVDGRTVLLHDTAGLRKQARTQGQAIEKLAVESTLHAIRFAECVVVVIDATAPFEKQDLTIADLVASEGRAIVFAVNKWDLVEDPVGAIGKHKRLLDDLLPQISGSPLVAVSALTGEGIDRLLPAVLAADAAWNTHIPTAELNRFLARALERHPPPAIRGRRVRVRYMTQPKARPPFFALFGTQLKALPESYLRYLQNELRATFGFAGTPIRFSLRTTTNPYAGR